MNLFETSPMAMVSYHSKLEELGELEVPCLSKKPSKMNSKVFWIFLAVTWTIVLFLVLQLTQFNIFKPSQHPESSTPMLNKFYHNSQTRATNDSSLNITEISNDLYNFMAESSHDLLGMKRSISTLSNHITRATNDSSQNITKISNNVFGLSNSVSILSKKVNNLSSVLETKLEKPDPSNVLQELKKKVSNLAYQYAQLSEPPKYSSPQLYVIGGEDSSDKYLSSVSQYNSSTKDWEIITDMSAAKRTSCGAVFGTKIYLFGGFIISKKNELSTAEIYDCETRTFTSIPSLPTAVSGCGAALLDGFIYVTGGNDGSKYSSNVIRYNFQTSRWENVRSMQMARNGHHLMELGGRLYAIGGFIGNNLKTRTKTVEMYEPSFDQWSMVASTRFEHFEFGAAVHEGKIYVCSHNGFEVYSPDTNTWKTLTLPNKNYGRTLVSMNGRLWALGGGEPSTKSVFTYDPSTRKWSPKPDMDTPRTWHTSFVVNH